MAIVLNLPGGGVLTWLGAQVTALVNRNVHDKLEQSGAAWLTMSRSLAPVKTGELRAMEDYRVQGNELILIMGSGHDLFQEFGTRNIPPHPHVRPALNAISRIWGTNVVLDFNAPYISSPVLHHKGSFIVPSGIQPKPLTAKQRHHVQNVLKPSAKGLHRGNVKRAKFRVRRRP